jgi:hypothetical protein
MLPQPNRKKTTMGILNKNLPPPPAPTELTPWQIEQKRRIEAEEAEKREKQRRLDEARKRIGKLSPQLISDVRLLCESAVDEVAMRDYCDPVTGKSYGVPFEAVRMNLTSRAPNCPCSQYMLHKDRVK